MSRASPIDSLTERQPPKNGQINQILPPAELGFATLKEGGQPLLAVLGRVEKRHRLPLGLDAGLEVAALRYAHQELAASDSHRRQLQQLARPLRRDLHRLTRGRDFVDQSVMERLLRGERIARV